MKKSALIFITLFLIIATFCSCNLWTKDAITSFVYVTHYYTGSRAPDWVITTVPSVWVSGRVSGTQLPAFDHLLVGDKLIEGKEIFTNQQGYIHFDSEHRIWSDSIAVPGFYPLTITVATDIGSVSGSVTIPDTLTSLTLSVSDTVALGTPVTVSWTGGNADYYQVCYWHLWQEDTWYWLGYSKDTLVTGSSVTFDSTYFTKNAELTDFEVYPINGPMPIIGATPNMTGDGIGYLYSENNEITSDIMIVFGEGINLPIFDKRPVKKIRTPEDRQESLRKKVIGN